MLVGFEVITKVPRRSTPRSCRGRTRFRGSPSWAPSSWREPGGVGRDPGDRRGGLRHGERGGRVPRHRPDAPHVPEEGLTPCPPIVQDLVYILSAALFVWGLKRLGSPATARSGNALAALAMLLAVAVTLLDREHRELGGARGGAPRRSSHRGPPGPHREDDRHAAARGVFNGLGGGASALVAAAEFVRVSGGGPGGRAVAGHGASVGSGSSWAR
jgi:hypothetical protein